MPAQPDGMEMGDGRRSAVRLLLQRNAVGRVDPGRQWLHGQPACAIATGSINRNRLKIGPHHAPNVL